MRRRRIFVVICVLAVGLGAGYFLHGGSAARHVAQADKNVASPAAQIAPKRHPAPARAHAQSVHRVVAPSASAELPPPGTPLKDVYAELARRAKSGDRSASVRLFHDTAKCRYAQKRRHQLALMLPTMLRISNKANPDPDLEKSSDDILNSYQTETDLLKKIEPLCAGLDKDELQSDVDWMRVAAQQGDRAAIDCYLNLDFFHVSGALRHPQWLADFQRIGLQMANRAVGSGDWKAVRLLEEAYDGAGSANWLTQMITPDREQAYRHAYLLQLGGTTNSFVTERVQALESELSPKAIATAQDWASETFSQNFHGDSMVPWELHTICPNPTTWPD